MAAVHAIRRYAARAMGLNLTTEQAEALWAECRPLMPYDDVAVEVENSGEAGGLDTMPREDLMSAMAKVMVGRDWPCNMEGRQVFQAFAEKMKVAIGQRGYAYHEERGANPANTASTPDRGQRP